MMIKYSIIVPVYNCEAYIADCLQSLLEQTYKEFEVIVVDDGSTDRTPEIISTFVDRFDNYLVINRGNQGSYQARREGLNSARGMYIVFVDADDYLFYDALTKIDSAITACDADIVWFGFSSDEHTDVSDDIGIIPAGLYSATSYREVKRLMMHVHAHYLWGKVFKRDKFDSTGKQDESIRLILGDDLYQILPVVNNSNTMLRIDDVLYYHRVNNASATGCFNSSYVDDVQVVIKRLLHYGKMWDIEEDAIEGCLQLCLSVLRLFFRYGNRNHTQRDIEPVVKFLNSKKLPINSVIRKMRIDQRILLRFVSRGRITCARVVATVADIVRTLTV